MISFILMILLFIYAVIYKNQNNTDSEGAFGFPEGSIGYLCSIMIIAFPLDLIIYKKPISSIIIGFLFILTIYYFRDRIDSKVENLPLFLPRHYFQAIISVLLLIFLIINYFYLHQEIISVNSVGNILIFLLTYFGGVFFSKIVEYITDKIIEREAKFRLGYRYNNIEKKYQYQIKQLKKQYSMINRQKKQATQVGNLERVTELGNQLKRNKQERKDLQEKGKKEQENFIASFNKKYDQSTDKIKKERIKEGIEKKKVFQKCFALTTFVVVLVTLVLISFNIQFKINFGSFTSPFPDILLYIMQINFGIEYRNFDESEI